MHKYPQNRSYVGSSGETLTTNVSMTLCDSQICHQTRVLCGCTTFGTKPNQVPNQYGPYTYCSLDKAVAHIMGGVTVCLRLRLPPLGHQIGQASHQTLHDSRGEGERLSKTRTVTCSHAPPPPPPSREVLEGVRGAEMHWKGGGGVTPPPSRAPSRRPATVSLTASARLNGICNQSIRLELLGSSLGKGNPLVMSIVPGVRATAENVRLRSSCEARCCCFGGGVGQL